MVLNQKAPMHKARTSSKWYLSSNILRETSFLNALKQLWCWLDPVQKEATVQIAAVNSEDLNRRAAKVTSGART